jgi:hypothetical protein
METRGLIFIPDISGFSKFVNRIEIEHSRLIIQELLETLINSNDIGLSVSEIEGDAILFYKFGDAPALEIVYRQVEKMFCEFHESIASYDALKYCQCTACKSAIELTLKVITHYGEFTEYQVKEFHKLIGKDLIVAHQLLKNDIEKHEYWLVTDDLARGNERVLHGLEWKKGQRLTEAGKVTFRYAPLSPLKAKVHARSQPPVDLRHYGPVLTITRTIPVDIVTMLHATGDYQYRHHWEPGLISVSKESHFLPRVGIKCRVTTASGEYIIYATGYSFSDNFVTFSEINETESTLTRYSLTKINETNTSLTVELYKKGRARAFWSRITATHSLERKFDNSLKALAAFAHTLNLRRLNEVST